MWIIMNRSTYVFAYRDTIEWTTSRELATTFHSKEEAKAFQTKNDLPGHVIPN